MVYWLFGFDAWENDLLVVFLDLMYVKCEIPKKPKSFIVEQGPGCSVAAW